MSGSKRVLIVDDDMNQLTILSTYLKKYDSKIEAACNGVVAAKKYKEKQDEIGLIVTDMQMPMGTGEQLIHDVHKVNPDVPIIILSGTGLDFNHLEGISNIKEILQKPINYGDFHSIVGKYYKSE